MTPPVISDFTVSLLQVIIGSKRYFSQTFSIILLSLVYNAPMDLINTLCDPGVVTCHRASRLINAGELKIALLNLLGE